MQSLQVLSRTQEVISNNLANINTAGFKKDKLFYHAMQDAVDKQDMRRVNVNQVLNISPGEMEKTGNPFDLAIDGDGFFQVEKNGQLFLTRNGRFHLDSEGYLRDENQGYVHNSGGSAVYIPEFYQSSSENEQNHMEIAKDGTVRLNGEVVDQIGMAKVNDLRTLERRNSSYLAVTGNGEIEPDTESTMTQGYYETGNINPLEEMTGMLTNFRLFESQQRALRTSDELLQKVTNNLGKF